MHQPTGLCFQEGGDPLSHFITTVPALDILSKHPGETQHISKLAGNMKAGGCLLFEGKQHVLIVVAIYRNQIIPNGQSPCGRCVLRAKEHGHDQTIPAGERINSEMVLRGPELTATSVTVTNLPVLPYFEGKKGSALAFAHDCYTK